ncbi:MULTISPECIES: hypothetical protein [unclassified Brenneria]|nr:hypothetical protein [Brenneria sp. hezel4-2-4]MEE3650960.1 hypothetical protein [Brenneria sp. HEZEL_4_2_4]
MTIAQQLEQIGFKKGMELGIEKGIKNQRTANPPLPTTTWRS